MNLRIACSLVLLVNGLAIAQENPAVVIVHESPSFGPSTLNELVSASKLIVRGVFGPALPPRLLGPDTSGNVPVRDHPFRILEVLKGDLKADTEILIVQSGGKWRDAEFRIANRLELTAGTEAVMFLLPTAAVVDDKETRARFYVNGLSAGAFLFNGDDVQVSRDVAQDISSVSKQGKREFLKRVQEAIDQRAR